MARVLKSQFNKEILFRYMFSISMDMISECSEGMVFIL